MFSIKICEKENVTSLMKFISNYWSKNHILGVNRIFFRWQHFNKIKRNYNFVIAISKSKIIGCHGFIKHSTFSENLSKKETIWMVNWLSLKEKANSGLSLLFYPINKLKYERIGTVGCNKVAKKIYKKFGFKTGNLNHYFLINPNIKSFLIIKKAKHYKNKIHNSKTTNLKKLKKTKNINFFNKDMESLVNTFGKDKIFFQNRYLKHPVYNYSIYIVEDNNKMLGFIVTRICKYKKSKVLRIVDFFGYYEALNSIGYSFEKLIIKLNVECIDFYEYGLPRKIMNSSGMNKNDFNNEIIVPNYFEPFIKSNIKIGWAIKQKKKKFIPIFKGDCDQDRPND